MAAALPALDSRLPERLRQAEAQRQALAEAGVHFAPLRHHSPACALALRAQLAEVRPAAVLIEGPADFQPLIPALLDERCRPPVAILSQHRPASDAPIRSAFFPFCEYSPEWQALREGQRLGAELAFIDLPWADAAHEPTQDSRNLMAERYLAHSRYLNALAREAHCRDHDELWEHLFELRPRAALDDWRRLFSDAFAWCSMARLDYEDDVLAAEGSLAREAHMLACIADWRARVDGPLVIVTGGFHTLNLVEALAAGQPPAAPSSTGPAAQAWLIRYGFERLDALNGYASGMPSPAYYQHVWDALLGSPDDSQARQRIAVQLLSHIAAQTRERQLADNLSFSSVSVAATQAAGLAALRGHPGPGRYDLLDALHSCFVKGSLDDGQAAFLAAIKDHLGGHRLGEVPPSSLAPPLVEEARRQAIAHRLEIGDSLPRRSRLDLYRKPRHRARSRFLQLMGYLGCGFARHLGGPDFINGTALDLLFEEWEYAWTPTVEARLIDCAQNAGSLREAAVLQLLDEERALAEHGQGRSAGRAVRPWRGPERWAWTSTCRACSRAWPSTWTKTRSWPRWSSAGSACCTCGAAASCSPCTTARRCRPCCNASCRPRCSCSRGCATAPSSRSRPPSARCSACVNSSAWAMPRRACSWPASPGTRPCGACKRRPRPGWPGPSTRCAASMASAAKTRWPAPCAVASARAATASWPCVTWPA
ncbi:MAG: hypothetical protein GAK45_00300 [Pseudomonas citronellolis]|nr:MAG: hypothetical protein GAK45_00300 [Pseudomonas citronellolis]